MQTTYDHVTEVLGLRPRQIAQHLRVAHGLEPTPVRKGYERELWADQHERAHYVGISGFIREVSAHGSEMDNPPEEVTTMAKKKTKKTKKRPIYDVTMTIKL